MARKRSEMDHNLQRGPATAALEAAMKIMADGEATEQKRQNICNQNERRFSNRFDIPSSVDSALLGFPHIRWQTGENQSVHQIKKEQMLMQIRDQLHPHHSPNGKHATCPFSHHHGLVRCIYFASDLSETAEIEERPFNMEIEDGSEGGSVMMTD